MHIDGGFIMNRTIIIDAFGGPENMQLVDWPVGAPGAGEARIRHHCSGLNFTDIYRRTGLYKAPLPSPLGTEGAGVVEALGDGVTHIAVGDRVAYASNSAGSYSDVRVMPAAQICKLPHNIDFETAAAVMLKGLTVNYLFTRTTPIAAGATVLFHAAAGGVGLLACQWARSESIRLIGTAGSDEKCALALAHGASHMINYRSQNFVEEVRNITEGRGVDVVMDSLGKDSFEDSLDCLRPLGMLISFGNATGPVTGVNLGMLAAKGSLQVTRPSLFTHINDPDVCQAMAAELFEKISSGAIVARIDQRFDLTDVAAAHRALESRQTTGATILTIA
jgi:NADPH2:quinone reductase